ncbi:hypothetical protein [Pelagerythrobacter marinus]|uniref:hypothetical protein n=1 Tax=Pelagerythrobacter marinus TaxID=538382 RepID=UPI002AC93CAC|nr:hypothetical protein [Pelagerythrobacter marinus]WPZ07577.1 hypothetical protein T8T98_03420 [Pelagerythrobacter marinus]
MAEGKSLKERNAWLIRAAMIGHTLAFVWVAAEPTRLMSVDRANLAERLEAAAAPSTAALGLIVIASLLLLGLVPPNWRDRLIHWRWNDPLPGSRAFSKIGPESGNVDMRRLRKEYGPLPRAGEKQNTLFYRIYRDHRDDLGVLDAHGRYLAARDVGTITALLMIALPWLAWWASGDGPLSLAYGISLFAVYALCVVAAKNYSMRMVQNVLAAATSAPEIR